MTLKCAWENATLVTCPLLPPTWTLSKSEEEGALNLHVCRKDLLKISITDWMAWYIGHAPSYTAPACHSYCANLLHPKGFTSLSSSSSSESSESSQVLHWKALQRQWNLTHLCLLPNCKDRWSNLTQCKDLKRRKAALIKKKEQQRLVGAEEQEGRVKMRKTKVS